MHYWGLAWPTLDKPGMPEQLRGPDLGPSVRPRPGLGTASWCVQMHATSECGVFEGAALWLLHDLCGRCGQPCLCQSLSNRLGFLDCLLHLGKFSAHVVLGRGRDPGRSYLSLTMLTVGQIKDKNTPRPSTDFAGS